MSKRSDDGSVGGDDFSSADTHWSQAAQRYYEPGGTGELTTAIVYAIADAQEVSPNELRGRPLYESVDVPAIEDAFFRPDGRGDSHHGVGSVEFRYTEYLVKVRSDGWVQVYEPTEPDRP
ncbi:hypothetical protein Harman_18470 [Haloarcula mannanilytica]|uniref:Halobacterial output domain-containing protein n=1 Tax=Haloarcula mannanilytica TaxID=2509225 RepID=A0A4C2EHS9_9EURY|nr:HalOD1 output domain-containing protein [Haloarcula mannanilytica]GCF13912.1 hypothetical protein Harman_18470 [Haloarcula mannanilytica]